MLMVKLVRASFLSTQRFGTRTRGRPLRSNAGRRARTPTLMPGRALTRPCPGTGQRCVQVGEHAYRCPFATARALEPPRRSNAGRVVQPVSSSKAFMRAVGVTTSPLTGLVLELALRARTSHRVCRLLFEFRPRLAQSSAEQSDRPAAADGRVALERQPRPASVLRLRTIAGLVG
jgi:hypothetical protein